ncbi:MAG: 6-phosphogluconolactonase, partial [Acidobacteria bacterium]|nr:6-phosphogluconolactonase [Acidobacteriota bacterium]
REQGRYAVALSGGSTPRGLHQELVTSFRSRLPWDQVFFFWGDERHVPPDFPESNYRMAHETLLSKLPIPSDHVFRMRGEMADAETAARDYEELLREFFRPAPGEFPRLDFILLGMGSDGHTASLFPGTSALAEKNRFAVANWVEQHSTFRLTLTYPVLNHAANVMFLISDGNKADVVRRALKDPNANLPCQGVQPIHGELMWYLDRAAGQRL